MSVTITASDHARWRGLGLQDYGDFADRTTEVNVGSDGPASFGEWFFVPAGLLPSGHRAIYFGSWDDDHPRGTPTRTRAELFAVGDPDELAEFTLRVRHWEDQPGADDQP